MVSHPTVAQLSRALDFRAVSRLQRTLRHPARELAILIARATAHVSSRTCRASARTFWGEQMEVALPEPVSLELFRWGFFDRGLTTIMLNHLRPGGVFFDIGAHFGYFSLLAKALVGPEGRVLSFEPTPSTFAVLARNMRGHQGATAYRVAVHEHSGTTSFSDFGVLYSAYNSMFAPRLDERNRRRARAVQHVVETWSVDDFAADHGVVPDFVKIDAETAEYAILKGMSYTLKHRHPIICVEVGDFDLPDAPSSRAVVELLLEWGYGAYEFVNHEILPHTLRERYEYTNLLFVPRV
jgi:FkbM family methyltransferase